MGDGVPCRAVSPRRASPNLPAHTLVKASTFLCLTSQFYLFILHLLSRLSNYG